MRRIVAFFIIVLPFFSTYAQYPFVHIPHSILDELATMEPPILPDYEVSSKDLPAIEVIWDMRLWNDRFDQKIYSAENPKVYIKHPNKPFNYLGVYINNDNWDSANKTTATFRRILNVHRQPITDTSIVYDYFQLRKNPQPILAGYYKLSIHAERVLGYTIYKNKYGVDIIGKSDDTTEYRLAVAYPIECWIYIGKVTNQLSPRYGYEEIIPCGKLTFYAGKAPPYTHTKDKPLRHNARGLSLEILRPNVNTSNLKEYFFEKYKIPSSFTINPYTKLVNMEISFEKLDSLERRKLFEEIESCDTLFIVSLHMEKKRAGKMGDFDGPSLGDNLPPLEFHRAAKIICFPNQNITVLKELLQNVGFVDIELSNCHYRELSDCRYYNLCFYAMYNGTFNMDQMNENFKFLFDQAHVFSIDLTNE